jgi:hypothetical protein
MRLRGRPVIPEGQYDVRSAKSYGGRKSGRHRVNAYQDAIDEIVRGSGYLPSKWHRGMIAAKMIVSADAGEGDVNRLKEAGLDALLDDLPLSLAFATRLRST